MERWDTADAHPPPHRRQFCAAPGARDSCPEELLDLPALPAQNARVEATLAIEGARVQEALYPLADYDSSQDSSGDEWLPVKRVARGPRRA